MRVAILQFSPYLGSVTHNILRANAILAATNLPEHLELLILPEMAFTGYNFPSLEAITPYLEPTAAGPSTQWAIETARRLGCCVIVGYPEICTLATVTTNGANGTAAEQPPTTINYNSTITVSPTGQILNNYRKSFLYYTDETWASEGHSSTHPTQPPFFCSPLGGLYNGARIGQGICMDISPYRFEAPFTAFEFANAMVERKAKLILLSMAWLTMLPPEELELESERPDMDTVAFWLERLQPLITDLPPEEGEVIVVIANRCGVEGTVIEGEEGGVEKGDRACFAGSSTVMNFQAGVVRMYERGPDEVAVLGKGEEGILIVDTDLPARFVISQKNV